jgi:glycosyltransferase involved in cell wall biosynthesis
VYTEHNLIERYHPATRLAARATWRLQSHVIAVSGEVGASVTRNLGAHIPLSIVANGVPLDRFTPRADAGGSAKAELGIEREAPVVGTVAVFLKKKRLDLWLDVARQLREALPQTKFLLVGDGPLRHEVEAKARELGLANHLLMPGLQRDVRPYLAAMDAYLMSSDFEGLPIALLEAMASGLTAVVPGVGGIAEVVEHERSGFIAPRGDTAALLRHVRQVLEASDEQRARWGAAARDQIAQGFSNTRMMREIERVYTDVARG